MFKLLFLLATIGVVASAFQIDPIMKIVQELSQESIKYSQNDIMKIFKLLSEFENSLKNFLSAPSDEKVLDQCKEVLNELKYNLKRFAVDHPANIFEQLLPFNRIVVTELALREKQSKKS